MVWEVGDVCWARSTTSMYWPAMIYMDFRNKYTRRKGNLNSYHVQFFGSKLERLWVPESYLLPFDYDVLSENIEKILSNSEMISLNFSMNEAALASQMPVKRRISHFGLSYSFVDSSAVATKFDQHVDDIDASEVEIEEIELSSPTPSYPDASEPMQKMSDRFSDGEEVEVEDDNDHVFESEMKNGTIIAEKIYTPDVIDIRSLPCQDVVSSSISASYTQEPHVDVVCCSSSDSSRITDQLSETRKMLRDRFLKLFQMNDESILKEGWIKNHISRDGKLLRRNIDCDYHYCCECLTAISSHNNLLLPCQRNCLRWLHEHCTPSNSQQDFMCHFCWNTMQDEGFGQIIQSCCLCGQSNPPDDFLEKTAVIMSQEEKTKCIECSVSGCSSVYHTLCATFHIQGIFCTTHSSCTVEQAKPTTKIQKLHISPNPSHSQATTQPDASTSTNNAKPLIGSISSSLIPFTTVSLTNNYRNIRLVPRDSRTAGRGLITKASASARIVQPLRLVSRNNGHVVAVYRADNMTSTNGDSSAIACNQNSSLKNPPSNNWIGAKRPKLTAEEFTEHTTSKAMTEVDVEDSSARSVSPTVFFRKAFTPSSPCVSLCPRHVCHSCLLDGKYSGQRSTTTSTTNSISSDSMKSLVNCVHCCATYHACESCVPCLATWVSPQHIICPRHTSVTIQKPMGCERPSLSSKLSGFLQHNVKVCVVCWDRGSTDLMLCSNCPVSVHRSCVYIDSKESSNQFLCDNCLCGYSVRPGQSVWMWNFLTEMWVPGSVVGSNVAEIRCFNQVDREVSAALSNKDIIPINFLPVTKMLEENPPCSMSKTDAIRKSYQSLISLPA